MTEFRYHAADPQGKEVRGDIKAEHLAAALGELRKQGLFPTYASETGGVFKRLKPKPAERKPKPRAMSTFCRSLVSILESGIPIAGALALLEELQETPSLQNMIHNVRVAVEKGESLSAAFEPYEKRLGGKLFTAVIAAGEASGDLETSFTSLAEQYEKDFKLRSMIRKAMIYPIVLLVITAVVITVVLTTVIPSFLGIFDQMGTELPPLTVAVVAASDFMRHSWMFVFGVILVLITAVRLFARTETGNHFFCRLLLIVPIAGKLSVKSAAARLARTLGTLTSGGIGLIPALEITASTMPNVLMGDALTNARTDVSKGDALSESLRKSKMFPALVPSMLKIGEESGRTETMLQKLADYYDEEVAVATAQIAALLEPIIILLMAGIIAVIVMSVMGPIADIYGNLQNL